MRIVELMTSANEMDAEIRQGEGFLLQQIAKDGGDNRGDYDMQ